MNIGDTIKIKLGGIEQVGRITAISEDVIVVSFDSANKVLSISRIAIGNEPDAYKFTQQDSEGRKFLTE